MSYSTLYSADAMDEVANSGSDGRWVKLEMRAQDEAGNPLTGTDRFYITVCVVVTGDNGSSHKEYITRKLADVATGILSNPQKLDLVATCKSAYAAGVKVATGDDV